MTTHKKTTAVVIVAAGQGLRAGFETPKQYQILAGKSVLEHTLAAFAEFDTRIVVAHPDYHTDIKARTPDVITVAGGDSRTASVYCGLAALRDTNPDYVLIHDAARPLVSAAVTEGVINALASHPAAVPALPLVDAIKTLDGSEIGEDANRDAMVAVQTPQGFHYTDILTAYDALPANAALSDDIAVAVNAGMDVAQTVGDANNFKLTHRADFTKAETIMSDFKTVTGSGFDVHRLVDGDHMHLCGVKIHADKTLLGHSDADVGLHAITDAIFGAMAAGDIGDHFPPD